MTYNFDEIIDRTGTQSVKIDKVPELWGRTDLLPMWVADMDFATPPCIINAIRTRIQHPIFGYTMRSPRWSEAIIRWQQREHQWHIQDEWLNFVPGIVPGIGMVIECLTQPGDKILIQPPVYHPYFQVPEGLGRQVQQSPLTLVNGQYEIDFDRFAADAKGCKLFLLCHPHNPGGRVWTREELQRMAQICQREGVTVVSDEIHADLTLPPYEHIPYAVVADAIGADNYLCMLSPSKAFNMAGLSSSYTVTRNPVLREQLHTYLDKRELNFGHLFAFDTVAAAYDEGKEWLQQMLQYVQGNIDYVQHTLREQMPRIGMIVPQASYLIFLDARALGLTQPALCRFFEDGAHLALNDGAMFGKEGTGFMRLNVACPRATLVRAMQQLKEAYDRQF